MRLVNPKNKKHNLYPHLFKKLESWGYFLEKYPQCYSKKPPLEPWQILEFVKALTDDAKRLNMLLRH